MNVELPLWETRMAWVLRALILATALWHVINGAYLYSLLCAAAIGLMLVPAYLARSNHASIPFEVELVFLWWLVADMSLTFRILRSDGALRDHRCRIRSTTPCGT